jgi:hypothetical protein
MKVFLWTMIVAMALSAIGKLIHLVKETGQRETPRGMDAFDVIVNAAMITWAVSLLP